MASLKFPICQGTYSTDCTDNFTDVSFLNGVMQAMAKQSQEIHPFFAGLCYNCFVPGSECPLQRCGGCQLVAYCSKGCQKEDWSEHKYVCKEFPVMKGKNVLYTKGSWKKHITGLREQAAARFPQAKPIFHNPRVCRTCKEGRQELLTDCRCSCVSYCSKKCSKTDKQHKNNCEDLFIISQLHTVGNISSLLHLLRERQCDKFETVSEWKDIMPSHFTLAYDNLNLCCMKDKHAVYLEDSLVKERLSYPMSLLYALQSLPERRITCSGPPLEDLTTLDIHVVTSIPLYDSKLWEIFMHRLPNLKHLNVVYVNQGRTFKQVFQLITLSFGRCDEVEVTRVIRSVSGHFMSSLCQHTLHTFRNRLCYSIDYYTQKMEPKTADKYSKCIVEILKESIFKPN